MTNITIRSYFAIIITNIIYNVFSIFTKNYFFNISFPICTLDSIGRDAFSAERSAGVCAR